MRAVRGALVLVVLARALAPEVEGASGAAPARLRLAIDASAWWPGPEFWDRFGGVLPPRRRHLPAPRPLGGPVDLDFRETPFRDALVELGRAADVAIGLDPTAPRQLAATPITLAAEGVSLRDAVELLLMQASPEGSVVFFVEGGEIRVGPKPERR